MSEHRDFDEQYVATKAEDLLPIRAEDDLLHAGRFPKSDLWEENTFVLVAECGDDDIFLWATAYHLRGHGNNVWLIDDGAEQETEFLAIPKNQRNKGLTDHDFIRLGWDPANRRKASELQVEQKSGEVFWRLGSRLYSSAPPLFHVRGEHGGVDLDLTFRQAAPAMWEWGDFATAPERDRGGYDTLCRVVGTIKVKDKVYMIKNGSGLKERITVGASSDPMKTLPAPREMYWLFTMAGETAVYLFHPGTAGVDLGAVSSGGRNIPFKPRSGQGRVSFTELERWHDPRCGLYFPSRWHLNMVSPEGMVDLDIRAHGRCWFNWVLKNGIRMNSFLLCTANGVFHRADGHIVEFKDELLANNWLRAYSSVQESF